LYCIIAKIWKRRGTRVGRQRRANGFIEFLMRLGDGFNRHYYENGRRGRGGRGRGRGGRGNGRESGRGGETRGD